MALTPSQINKRMRTYAKDDTRKTNEYKLLQREIKNLPTSARKYNRKTKQYEFVSRLSPKWYAGSVADRIQYAFDLGNQLPTYTDYKKVANKYGITAAGLSNVISKIDSEYSDTLGTDLIGIIEDTLKSGLDSTDQEKAFENRVKELITIEEDTNQDWQDYAKGLIKKVPKGFS